MSIFDGITRLSEARLANFATHAGFTEQLKEWIVLRAPLLREHLLEVWGGATKQKVRLKAKSVWSIEPEAVTFESYTAKLGIEGETRMLIQHLFQAVGGKVYFNLLLQELQSAQLEADRSDKLESKIETKADDAGAMRQLRAEFEDATMSLASKIIYPFLRIFVPKDGNRTFYIAKARNGSVHEKQLGDGTDPSLFRWFRAHVWTPDGYSKIAEAVDALADRYPMFPETKSAVDWFRLAVRLMDAEVEEQYQLDDTTMAIITEDKSKWAWGVIDIPEGDKAKATPAWDQWEGKFACPQMRKWWRVWMGLIFDTEVATGVVTDKIRSKANLGLVWIRSTGKEGSSVVMNVIAAQLGESVTATIRGQFDQFEMSGYFGKRMAHLDDARFTRILYRGHVHSIITGGEQSIETKGNQAYKGFLNCGIVCTSNARVVANRFAKDQMRRLLYLVLNKTTHEKTADWERQLHDEFPDYMAKVRETYAKAKAKYGTQDIFHHYEDEAIMAHYAAQLGADQLGTVHEEIMKHWQCVGSCRVEGLRNLYRNSLRKLGHTLREEDFEEVVLRHISESFEIHGNTIEGLTIEVTADEIANAVLGNFDDGEVEA